MLHRGIRCPRGLGFMACPESQFQLPSCRQFSQNRRIRWRGRSRYNCAHAMALIPGTKLGPYEILAPLGSGGMGEVYRACDTRLGRDVAIKVLPEALTKDADRLRRFEQEARTIAALNHPNILGIHDIGTYDGAPFLVSELLPPPWSLLLGLSAVCFSAS